MADSLNPLQYGTVVGRFLVELGDSDDPDLTPDVYPVRGYLVFTPATSYANVKTALPDPATVFPQPIYGVLDAEGYVCTVRVDNKGVPVKTAYGDFIATERGIRMQASSDPNIIPSNWTWNVRFNFTFNNTSIAYDPFNFTLDPFQVADLSYIKPITSSTGTITITGPKGSSGEPGPKGDTGPANELSVGTVSTGLTGSTASASITGDVPNQELNLILPAGPPGPSGGPIPAGGSAGQSPVMVSGGGFTWQTALPIKEFTGSSGDPVDLNTLVEPGIYPIPSASYITNEPPGGAAACTVIVYPFNSSGSYLFQEITYWSSHRHYIRSTNTSSNPDVWKAWREMAGTEVATSSSDGLMSSSDKQLLDGATASIVPSAIVERWGSGDIWVPEEPSSSGAAVSKAYVDSKAVSEEVVASITETRNRIDKKIDCSKHLFIGDSISSLPTDQIEGRSYTIFVPAMSDGKMFRKASTAMSGNRADQQLTRVRNLLNSDDDFTSASIMIGTNELSQEVAMSTWQANVNTLVTELRAKQIEPVLMTLPPRSGPIRPTPPSKIISWNNWIKEYAYENDLLCVDVWRILTDPVTQEYKPGIYDTSDGVHTNGRGQMLISKEFIRVVGPHMEGIDPGSINILTPEANDRLDILPVGIFESATTPTGWVLTNATMVRDSNAAGGYAIDIDVNNPSGNVQAYPSQVTGGFSGGDTVRVVIKARVISSRGVYSGAGMQLLIRTWQGANWTDAPLEIYGQNLMTREYLEYRQEVKLPAGTDGLSFYWKYDKGTSPSGIMHSRVASMGVYNLKNALI